MGILSNTLWAINHIINNWVSLILGGSNINLNEYNIYIKVFRELMLRKLKLRRNRKLEMLPLW